MNNNPAESLYITAYCHGRPIYTLHFVIKFIVGFNCSVLRNATI